MTETVQSEFRSEVETYREAMDSLHRTASGQQESLEHLDQAMSSLQESVAEMSDAFDEYDHAIHPF